MVALPGVEAAEVSFGAGTLALWGDVPEERVLFGSHVPFLQSRAAVMKIEAPYVAAGTRRAEWVRESSLHGLGRAGGIGVAAGLLASLLARLFDDSPLAFASAHLGLMLLASAAPVFAAGLIEDLTQRVSKEVRLAAAFI